MNVAGTDLLCSYHRKGAWSLRTSLCMQSLSFIFVLMAINFACLGALQYWLSYICKCKASVRKFRCHFFHKATHLPHNIHGASTFKTGNQQLLAVWMANAGISTVDGDMEQFFGPADLVPSITCVPTHAERLSTLNFDFSVKVVLRQKIYLIRM